MQKTYMCVIPSAPAMEWEEYAEIVECEWNVLLSSPRAKECDFQNFLEQHPCFLPQAAGNYGNPAGHHGPFPSTLIAQPVLPGYSKKVPDFLWITRDSASVYATLIEIEDPKKRWATASGQSSNQFTQATNQLADWKVWFKEPLNAARFLQLYRVPEDWCRSRSFEQRYILVYGRRSDPTLTEAFNKKRKQLERDNETYMTFDRLRPDKYLSHCLCSKLDEKGYKAISVPPTIQLSPGLAAHFRMIRDKELAVKRSGYLPEIRKQFLMERWSYWDNWSGGGVIYSLDRE